MLVNPDRGAVDHLHLAVVSHRDRGHNPVEHARFAPTDESVVARRPRPKRRRQGPPRRPGSEHPEDPIQHAAVVNTRLPTGLVRQQRLDHAPLEIRQRVLVHASPPTLETESRNDPRRIPVYAFTAQQTIVFIGVSEFDA